MNDKATLRQETPPATEKQKTSAETMPLKARLERSERLFEETGYYQGRDKLELHDRDPLRFEQFHSRLLSTVISVRDTMKHIAASPAIRDFEEFVIGLYTPEGDAICLSTGIMVHVHTLSEFIKFMIRNGYEKDPKIRPGDIFENNELWAGGVHTPDVMTVIPVYHEGELIAWIGAVTHELETGTYEGPGMTMFTPERYGEGIHMSAEKVGEDYQFRQDYMIGLKMNLRNADWWILDDRAKLAGSLMVKEQVERLIEEYGLGYYKQAVEELIEEGRRNFIRKVRRMMVPGKYRGRQMTVHKRAHIPFLHPLAKTELNDLICMDFTVTPEGTLELEYEGSTGSGFHPFNCGVGPMNGGFWITITQLLAYDGRVNDGAYHAVKQWLPEGTIVNTTYKGAGSSIAWWNLIPLFVNLWRLIGTSWFARGFLEEIIQSTATCCPGVAGFDQYGEPTGYNNFEFASESFGARGVADGLDCGSPIWNSEGMQGDAEVWEMTGPNVYLGRNFVPDHHGYGRFRGGSTWESLWMVRGSKLVSANMNTTGGAMNGGVFVQGLFGGYPPPGWKCFWAKGTNLKELIDAGEPLPGGINEAERMLRDGHLTAEDWYCGKLQQWTPTLSDFDLFGIQYQGGAGYGDPLERDPDRLEKDVLNRLVRPETARKVYGCGDSKEETDQLRSEIRKRRLQNSEPASEWWERRRKQAQEGDCDPMVAQMYARSAKLSDALKDKYLKFWQLDAFPYTDTGMGDIATSGGPKGFIYPSSSAKPRQVEEVSDE